MQTRSAWRAAVVAAMVACGGEGKQAEGILALTGDPENGARVYAAECEACHGPRAMGEDDPVDPGVGESLIAELGEDTDEDVVEDILYGEEEMPAYEDVLTDQEIADVLAFLHQLAEEAELTGGTERPETEVER